jgi:GSH-dependent disulfide-bond oxidoreductase
MRMIEVHGMGSPNVLKVLLALEELGLEYRTRHVAVLRLEQFTPEFLALNPLGKAPVLVDGEQTVFESGAILIYLAERYGGLLPSEGPARYEALQWLMVQVANVGPMLGQLNHFVMLPADTSPYALARYREQARRVYRVLEERLATSPWLGGANFGVADAATWPWVKYLAAHGFDWGDHPAIEAWRGKIAARPAAARALARMKDFVTADMAAGAEARPEELDRFLARTTPGPTPDFSVLARA